MPLINQMSMRIFSHNRPVLYFGAFVALAFLAITEVQGQDRVDDVARKGMVNRIESAIAMIAKGEPNERQAIVAKLVEDRKMSVELLPFASGSRKGTNLKTELSGKELPADQWLILGAHLDRVAVGQGIIDNGCGCIALMELASRLQAKPLPNLRVTAMFYDLEENGLLGSKAYVATLKEKPRAYLNLDVFAYGREMWLHTLDENDPFVGAAKEVDSTNPLTLDHGVNYPPSDHLSYRAKEMYSISFSLLPHDEIQEVEAMFGGDRKIRPKILSTIHTADDVPSKASPVDICDGVDFLEATLRKWSENGAKQGRIGK